MSKKATAAADAAADGKHKAPENEDEKLNVPDGYIDMLGTKAILRKCIFSKMVEDAPVTELGDEVLLRYQGFLLESDQRFSVVPRMKIRVGSGDALPGIELGVRMLKVGDVVIVHCVSRFGYEDIGLPAALNDFGDVDVAPGAKLRFQIEVLDITQKHKTKDDTPFTMGQVLAEATKKKTHGNLFYQQKHFAKSARSYATAIQMMGQLEIEGGDAAPPPQLIEAGRILITALGNNLSNAQYKMNNYKEAVQASGNVLQLDPDNIKALYRYALGQHALDNLDDAMGALMKANGIDPSNVEIKLLTNKVILRQAEVKKKEKELYNKMMPESSKRSESVDELPEQEDIDGSLFEVVEEKRKVKVSRLDLMAMGALMVFISIFFRIMYKKNELVGDEENVSGDA